MELFIGVKLLRSIIVTGSGTSALSLWIIKLFHGLPLQLYTVWGLCECTALSPWFYMKDQGVSLYFNHNCRWTSLQEWFVSLDHKYQKLQSSNCLKSAVILHWNSFGNFSLSLLKGHHSMHGTFCAANSCQIYY